MSAADLKRRWQAGEVTYGASVSMDSPWVAEVFAHAGLDFIKIDFLHGMNMMNSLYPMFLACAGTKTTPLVRVGDVNRQIVGRLLDLGAEGVQIPMCDTPEQAAELVSACTIGDGGTRSQGTMRLKMLPGGVTREVLCFVMIETLQGLENVEKIAKVPGLTGMTIGSGDLAHALGLAPTGGIQPGPHEEAINRVKQACIDNGLVPAIQGPGREMAARGYQMIQLGSDSGFFEAGLQAALDGC